MHPHREHAVAYRSTTNAVNVPHGRIRAPIHHSFAIGTFGTLIRLSESPYLSPAVMTQTTVPDLPTLKPVVTLLNTDEQATGALQPLALAHPLLPKRDAELTASSNQMSVLGAGSHTFHPSIP